MARVKISEYRAKTMLANAFGWTYLGREVNLGKLPKELPKEAYAVKVDQAVKQRNKQGLVTLNRNAKQAISDLSNYKRLGYAYALLEPMIEHKPDEEKFIALERTANGIRVSYSNHGGIDIEAKSETIKVGSVSETGKWEKNIVNLDLEIWADLYNLFQDSHATYLELNPFIIHEKESGKICIPLDAAMEVDSAAEFVVRGEWDRTDIRLAKMQKSESEKKVETIQANSSASFSLRVLNPNGSLFLLLSGGGASVVLADELSHKGLTGKIANYGEYSGNPNEEETYQYTLTVIELLKNSKASHRALLIAGGVANFTDIVITFKGIIRALQTEAEYIKKHDVNIYVRRGGPNQEEGLAQMRDFLDKLNIHYLVFGPDVSLADFINLVVKEFEP